MKQISEDAILFLSKHFRKKIKLEEIARIAGLSPFYFHRKFVEENNCTPQDYLTNIRMQHASHLLEVFPDRSLVDVAFECGYSSPGIFSRAFKNYYGTSPSKYKLNFVHPTETERTEAKPAIPIRYLSQKAIAVKKVMLLEGNLNLAYQELQDSLQSDSPAFGFFLDIPFHDVPLKECRYFMGVEATVSNKNASVLILPAGYYTSIIVQGVFARLKERLRTINQQINSNGYVIDSLIGYERIHLTKKTTGFDYMQSTREVLIKIKRE